MTRKFWNGWLFLLALAVGFNLALGTRLFAKEESDAAEAAAADTPEEMYSLFATVVEQVRAHYVDADASTYENLVQEALRGMLQALDPYSQFMDKEEYAAMREDTAGKFGGLGITIGIRDNLLSVISPMEGTPAFRAGILSGDKILEIDGESTEGMALEAAVKRLRGDPGTTVDVKIFRPRTQLTKVFTIERAVINVASVKDARILDGNVGYVRLLQFGEDTVKELQTALQDLQSKGAEALVLDLRGNPGGLLRAAVEVSQFFLKRGDLVVFTRGRDGKIDQSFRARPNWRFPQMPMAVLINGGSASASEIVAGALQDNKRAILVGEKSFGKGSVQTILPQEGDTAIRLTTAKYYTPSERVIHDNGIEPDVVVPVSYDAWRRVLLARNRAEVIEGEDRGDEGWAEEESGWVNVDGDETTPEEADDLDLSEEPRDAQLERACDMLRGVLVFQKR